LVVSSCLTVQSALVQTSWPKETLSCSCSTKLEEPRGLAGKGLLFNGPRVQMGVTRLVTLKCLLGVQTRCWH